MMRARRRAAGSRRTRLTRRGRAALGLFLAAVVAGVGIWLVQTGFIWGNDPGRVERVCVRPDELRTRRGITLAPQAMEALRRAEEVTGRRIEVVQSFRSCAQQARACKRICGNRRGCPGTCAPPGFSWHQRGLAIDITEAMLQTPGVVRALERAGWCQAVPETDPGHFSFGGCH